MPSRVFLVVACFPLALTTPRLAYGQGGPPLITEDPGTPGAGRWEINIAFMMEQRRTGREFEAPVLDINYGLGDHIQLKFEVPWVTLDPEGEESRNGLGNAQIGLKWRFLDEDRHGVSMSIYPQLGLNLRNSSHERGLVDRGTEFLLPLQVARTLGPFEVSLELGYTFIEEDLDEWVYGIAVAYPLSDQLELLGEVAGTAGRDFGADELVFNLGAAYEVDEHLRLLLSLGRSFRDSARGEPELLIYFGLQFNF